MAATSLALRSNVAESSKQKNKKNLTSTIGAPAQRSQSSRKGKRAWRKNIDIDQVEGRLEELRTEEREFGKPLQKHDDSELFQIDVTGDADIRKRLPRYSKAQLTSTKILSQRSAVPAVVSRTTPSSKKRKSPLSQEDKARLLRMGKRMRRGPFNSVMDPTEFGNGSCLLELSEAVKKSGTYDAWAAENDEEDIEMEGGFATETPPPVPHPKDKIEVPAIAEPHQGTSYNPLASAYQDLLLKAHETEERRVNEIAKVAAVKDKMAEARHNDDDGDNIGLPRGMKLDTPLEDDTEAEDEVLLPKKRPERKTKAQRNKAAKALAERRILAAKAARKQLLVAIDGAKAFRKSTEQSFAARQLERLLKRQILLDNLKYGLAGKRLGKHKVPEGNLDVQLGDDLSESLRALKPEGNLFKDRFISLQHRALIEPRAPVIPKKRRTKMIEYEKHAWKRFE
ncbi:P60-like protein [Pleurotus eryngii]|uniref:Ribosome biogenesis protein NOP53 n=1 Tax=Pleurotus eryngii TaxID=5323 RepID=A0A9P6D8H5_PLEER|nr:P60-like protein [Pleurotus eryngii]